MIPTPLPGSADTALSGRRRYLQLVRMIPMLIALVLITAACGSDDATTSTTSGATTTVAPGTTTAAPSTTTAAPTTTEAMTTTVATTTTTTPPDTNSLASGSGCTPGTADSLPDGEWFGFVEAAADGSVDFDLACWFNGEAAAAAAAEDGEESPPPNDYYVRNTNSGLRTLTVAGSASVTWLPNPGDPSTEETVDYAAWLAGRAARDFQPSVWLTIEDGAVARIVEQFTP